MPVTAGGASDDDAAVVAPAAVPSSSSPKSVAVRPAAAERKAAPVAAAGGEVARERPKMPTRCSRDWRRSRLRPTMAEAARERSNNGHIAEKRHRKVKQKSFTIVQTRDERNVKPTPANERSTNSSSQPIIITRDFNEVVGPRWRKRGR